MSKKMEPDAGSKYARGVSKIDRYKWSVVDKPGVLMEIKKDELFIDSEYQRDVREGDGKVLKMASQWSWIACGVLIVAMRGGRAFVLDGQHRLLAARKRSDIAFLPCVVFDEIGQRGEASGFLRANRNRKPMRAASAFKAMLIEEDPAAIVAAELIRLSGREISSTGSGTTFAAVGALRDAVMADEALIRKIWPAICNAYSGAAIETRLIRAALYAEQAAIGCSLADPRWSDRLARLGPAAISKAMDQAKEYHQKTGEKVWAAGLVNALNKGLRGRTFQTKGDAA